MATDSRIRYAGVARAREVLEKIWKPFFTTKAKEMGLGLAICRRIVEALQGKIQLKAKSVKAQPSRSPSLSNPN